MGGGDCDHLSSSANWLDLTQGRTGWIISDGKAGNDAQCLGVAEALGLAYEIKSVSPSGVWRLLSPYGPVDPTENFGDAGSPFCPPWPDFAIAAGRLTTPYIRALKRHAGRATFTVILLDPRTGTGAADLFWVPEHDRLRGRNVITTLTAPHRFSPLRLAELRKTAPPFLDALKSPRVAVLLGGPNGVYRYTPVCIARLITAVESLSALGAGLMATASRRTPLELREGVRAVVSACGGFFWDGDGENPYPHLLAHADAFLVTADSINMTGEPCVTGKPVYVFEPEGGSRKFSRFHESLYDYGATRPCPDRFASLDRWSYEPLHSASSIAREIARRFAADSSLQQA